MHKEEWKDIKGYEGKYQVSNLGRVRSIPRSGKHCTRKEAKIMFLSDRKGYKAITLYKSGKRKTISVHKLVAEAFVPNTKSKPVINHVNGDRADNRAENLEWVTQSENVQHSFDVLKNYNTDNKSVVCIETGEIFKSMTEASIQTGANRTRIGKCCANKPHCHTAGGYHWRYKEVD